MTTQQSDARLAELILYISQRSAEDSNFGQTKLHKILFFSDFSTFGRWGELITGAEYQHLPFGPGVKRMLPVQTNLRENGDLAIQRVSHFNYGQERPVALRDPDLTMFKGQEIATVNDWIQRLWAKSASDVSFDSHETAAWSLTKEGETIDPRSVFIAWSEPTPAEHRRGRVLAEELGLLT